MEKGAASGPEVEYARCALDDYSLRDVKCQVVGCTVLRGLRNGYTVDLNNEARYSTGEEILAIEHCRDFPKISSDPTE
jgi:hypothetical protein